MHDAAQTCVFGLCTRNHTSKDTLSGWDHTSLAGDTMMNPQDEYLLRAAELSAMAQIETDPSDKLEFENLARAYLRLAKQAERNSQTDFFYVIPLEKKRNRA